MVKFPLRVQCNSAEKLNLVGKIKVFLSFPHIMWNSFATSNEIGRVVKLAFIISSGTFWGKSKLNETVFRFSPCFDFEQKHWVELPHLLPRCRGERSERKHNFELNSNFFNLAEWFSVELRTTIHVSRRKIPATFFWKISFLFWFSDFEQNSCKTFPEMLSAIFSELTSLCPEDQIEKTSVSWKIQTFFNNSGLWAKTWYNFWQKWFRQACQKRLLLVQRNFLMRTILRKLLQKWLISEFGRKIFGRMVKLPLLVQCNSAEKLKLVGKIKVFCRSQTLCETLSQLQTKLAGLSS